MGRRGKKPRRKGYFYEEQEQAVVDYINAETKEDKERIFNEYLLTAFTKMVESIIRRYNLYPPDEEFDETFNDTISFLMTKMDHFKPESGYKAYSYCGTICKNYLIYKINQFSKRQKIRFDKSQIVQTLRYKTLQCGTSENYKTYCSFGQNKRTRFNRRTFIYGCCCST